MAWADAAMMARVATKICFSIVAYGSRVADDLIQTSRGLLFVCLLAAVDWIAR